MTLVGFRARNHPQQTAARSANPDVDDRGTTDETFEPLDRRFGFTLDVAASDGNKRCARFFDRDADGLAQSWAGERVWCNPPYSALEPWAAKAWAELDRAELVVMLVPANRTEQGWWQRLVEPYRDRGGHLSTEFLPGRLRFYAPGSDRIGPNERPPFGCVLLVWRLAPSGPRPVLAPTLWGDRE